jgi:hypothetical protein
MQYDSGETLQLYAVGGGGGGGTQSKAQMGGGAVGFVRGAKIY